MATERIYGARQYSIGNIALNLKSEETLCDVITFPRSSHHSPSKTNALKEIIDALKYGDCRGCDITSEPKSMQLLAYGCIALGFLIILGAVILPVLV